MQADHHEPDRPKRIDWTEHLEAQARGGLSIRGYCKTHGLKESAFYYHRSRQKRGRPRVSGFIQIPNASSGIRLRHSDGPWCVEIERGFDARLLRELLGALSP